MKFSCLTAAAALLMLPLAANAAELAINPGLWETTMTRTNPMTGDPTTETTTECVKQTSFNPSDMVKEAKGCELVKDELNGDTLEFRMECNVQGSKATMDGRFQTDGQTGNGNMDMVMKMGEMNMTMNMEWTSKRIGDC